MRAIAPIILPNVCPRQGRRRPTPTFFCRRRSHRLRACGGLRPKKWFCLPPEGSLEARAEVLCRRRRQRNYGSNMRRRPCAHREATGQRQKLAEGTSLRGIKPPRYTSAEWLFSCWGSVAVLPSLANCNEHEPIQTFRDRARPHPAYFARRLQLERLQKHFILPLEIHARTLSAFPVSRAKLSHGVSYLSSLFPALFSHMLSTSRLLLRAILFACRRVSAATRWAPSFWRWCAASTASAATASTAATTTRSSAASAWFTTKPRAASTFIARFS